MPWQRVEKLVEQGISADLFKIAEKPGAELQCTEKGWQHLNTVQELFLVESEV